MCLPSRCLETVDVYSLFLAVVAYQRLYMLQYVLRWLVFEIHFTVEREDILLSNVVTTIHSVLLGVLTHTAHSRAQLCENDHGIHTR
jgi:hypothetical protein